MDGINREQEQRTPHGTPPVKTVAVGYVRASTAEQEITLAMQAEKLRAYCALRGLDLVEVVEDAAVSGSVPLAERPAGQRVAGALKRHKATHVVALKLDRLFRDAADALAQTKGWDKAGVALHLCDMGGGTVDTSSPMGRMMLTMLAGFAEFERALIAERTGAAIRHKQTLGQYIGGHAPYGYRLTDDGALAPDPAEQEVVAEARRLKAAGLSLRAIAAELERAGRLARSGKPFAPSAINKMAA
jgi:DNA invertase Pin-like site-specific DNA recombinase